MKFYPTIFALFLFAATNLMALGAGDIAFVQYSSDASPDEFAFVVLTNIPANEIINFTDCGWTAAGAFRTGEGVVSWTAPTAGVTAGTVISVTAPPNTSTPGSASAGTVASSGFFTLSTSGDQLIAFQGDLTSPTSILAAINNQGSGWQADTDNSNDSALPTGLTNGVNAIALSETDNAAYTGSVTGDAATVLAAVNDPANWASDNNATVPYTGTIVLPIELVAFKAETKGKTVVLSWKTLSETNNKAFVVERAANINDFQKITTLKGTGSIETQQQYNFTDESPLNGKSYYRLKQIDYDGSFSYSPIQSVQMGARVQVGVYPNPASDVLQVDLGVNESEKLLYVVNQEGRIVKTVIVQSGEALVSIEIADLPEGQYLLIDRRNDAVEAVPFVKH